ncbi:MAG: hypothetical protein ABJH45_06560 [Paracoccaceae bacterium]
MGSIRCGLQGKRSFFGLFAVIDIKKVTAQNHGFVWLGDHADNVAHPNRITVCFDHPIFDIVIKPFCRLNLTPVYRIIAFIIMYLAGPEFKIRPKFWRVSRKRFDLGAHIRKRQGCHVQFPCDGFGRFQNAAISNFVLLQLGHDYLLFSKLAFKCVSSVLGVHKLTAQCINIVFCYPYHLIKISVAVHAIPRQVELAFHST